jgi:hypothetical protein
MVHDVDVFEDFFEGFGLGFFEDGGDERGGEGHFVFDGFVDFELICRGGFGELSGAFVEVFLGFFFGFVVV